MAGADVTALLTFQTGAVVLVQGVSGAEVERLSRGCVRVEVRP